MTQTNSTPMAMTRVNDDTVVIAGGGPVGLLVSYVLAHYGVKSVLLERNKSTTKWPKMDLTNARSMEIFRRLGLADELRSLGVPPDKPYNVLISTGLSRKEPITRWDLPGVDKYRRQIKDNNDGTQPLEPWQRISQVIFERWLKSLCEQNELIDIRFGCKVGEVEEVENFVRTTTIDVDSGETLVLESKYMVGCDGASSKTRTSLELPLDGGPTDACVLLIHFKSRDLTRLHAQGLFWHLFMLTEPGVFGGSVVAQDEVDTWTVQMILPANADASTIDSHEAIYLVLGGLNGKYEIEVDEILVRSVWRPNIAVARMWAGKHQRVFIAGDAAHQNIPTGGYGMNMGIGDAYDLGWKLAATINGYAGQGLLRSYQEDRRPVALRNVERSGVHMAVHSEIAEFLACGDPHRVDGTDKEAQNLRAKIHEHYQINSGENRDLGIEMGYRYASRVVVPENGVKEPPWTPSAYIPTTWPGSRPPHLFLKDGTPIFDTLGRDWTLIVFAGSDVGQTFMLEAANSLSIPLKCVDLSSEELAQKLWEKKMVLVRPDEHVAWRGDTLSGLNAATQILQQVVGSSVGFSPAEETNGLRNAFATVNEPETFTSTIEMTTQVKSFALEGMGDFQR